MAAAPLTIKINAEGIVSAENGEAKLVVSAGGVSTLKPHLKTDRPVSDTVARMVGAGESLKAAVAMQVIRTTAKHLLAEVDGGAFPLNNNDVAPDTAKLEEAKRPKEEDIAAAMPLAVEIAAHTATFIGFVGFNLVKSGHHYIAATCKRVATRILDACGIKAQVTEVFDGLDAGLAAIFHAALHIFAMTDMMRLAVNPPAELHAKMHGIVAQRIPATPAAAGAISNGLAAWEALEQSASWNELAQAMRRTKELLQVEMDKIVAAPQNYDATNPANRAAIARLTEHDARACLLVATAYAAGVASESMMEAKSYQRVTSAYPSIVANGKYLTEQYKRRSSVTVVAQLKGILVAACAINETDNAPACFHSDEMELEVATQKVDREIALRKLEVRKEEELKKVEARSKAIQDA